MLPRMKKLPGVCFGLLSAFRCRAILIAALLLGPALACMAPNFVSSEDQSRFSEQSFKKAEPGMPPPAAYIALAEKSINAKYKNVFHSKDFQDPVVTRRTYRNAPKEDKDMICVAYVYRTRIGGGGSYGPNGVFMNPNEPFPVLQALIRKDRSKVYVNLIEYRME